ncbi:hypothetical protein IR012_08385 [Pseudomonas putida]|uniref:hypothetical protein n=1 Tax=Pseudomonas putida TaxID=303 RepID=UPI0018A8DCFD|nr:hypothetical protein [Pseudomonas putida]MBF8669584.1 hypothetical protein [Pseudomonas putida]MBF8712333.1 hypothetical protein [Pseudomonas putida]
MNKVFDMELFLAAVLTGSHSTQQRHLRQARGIHAEISERWQRQTPWALQKKHVDWFLEYRLRRRSAVLLLLTVRLLARRLQKTWVFNL